jgi:hypothetical protein
MKWSNSSDMEIYFCGIQSDGQRKNALTVLPAICHHQYPVRLRNIPITNLVNDFRIHSLWYLGNT